MLQGQGEHQCWPQGSPAILVHVPLSSSSEGENEVEETREEIKTNHVVDENETDESRLREKRMRSRELEIGINGYLNEVVLLGRRKRESACGNRVSEG